MNKIGRAFALLLFMMALTLTSSWAEFSVQAQVDKTAMTPDDVLDFVLNMSGSGNLPNLNLPTLEDFDVLGTSRMSRMNMINGAITRGLELHFQLRPKHSGTLHIPSFKIDIEGKPYSTVAITVVVSGTAKAAQAGSNSKQAAPLFMEASTPKTSYFVGEPIIYSLKIYNQLQLFGQPSLRDPQFHNLMRVGQSALQQRQETKVINGRQYQVNIIPMLLSALAPGDASIDPVSMVFSLSPFDPNREVRSNPVAINIVAVPHNAIYDQAVGQFQVNTSYFPQTLRANEAVTVKVTISGQGNLKLTTAPRFRLPNDIEAYAPKSQLKETVSETGITSEKVFELTWVPRSAGQFTIPAATWTYFNPTTGQFVSLSTAVININVQKGPARTAMVAAPSTITSEASDIRYLHPIKKDWASNMLRWGLSLFIVTVFGVLIRYRRQGKLIQSWFGSLRPEAKLYRHLKPAMSDENTFYPTLMKEVSGILIRHYHIPPGHLSSDELRKKYPSSEWVNTWQKYESKSYQPNIHPTLEEMNQAINDMVSMIRAIRTKSVRKEKQ